MCTKVPFLGCATGCSRQSTCMRRRMCVGCWEMWKTSLRWLRTLQTEFVNFKNDGRGSGLGRCPMFQWKVVRTMSEYSDTVSDAICEKAEIGRPTLDLWSSRRHAFRKPYSCGLSESGKSYICDAWTPCKVLSTPPSIYLYNINVLSHGEYHPRRSPDHHAWPGCRCESASFPFPRSE